MYCAIPFQANQLIGQQCSGTIETVGAHLAYIAQEFTLKIFKVSGSPALSTCIWEAREAMTKYK